MVKFDDIFYINKKIQVKTWEGKKWLQRLTRCYMPVCYIKELWFLIKERKKEKIRIFFPKQNKKVSYLIATLGKDFSVYDKYERSRWSVCWKKGLDKIFFDKDQEKLEKKVFSISKWLCKMDFKAVILLNDLWPVERLVIEGAKMAGIPSICIQHGFVTGEKKYINMGIFSDYFLTWGEYLINMYEKNNLKERERMKALGYHCQMEKIGILHNNTLLFIGQGNIGIQDKEKIYHILDLCQTRGIRVGYKPHPRAALPELEELKVKGIEIVDGFSDDTLGVFKQWDIICGWHSSMLVEAYLADKPCFQIGQKNDLKINFEKIKICPKFYSDNHIEMFLNRYLESQEERWNYFKDRSDYAYLNENYASSVRDFLMQVIKL